jgi:(p)ppGpp synthase/HD superfamily hydrolase
MNPLTHAIKFATHAYRTHAHTPNARNDISSLTILAILRKLPLELPTDIYVAAVLHDTLKDAKLTMADITHHYGASVAFLVDALTKNIERHPGVADRVHEKRYLSRLMDVAQPRLVLSIFRRRAKP